MKIIFSLVSSGNRDETTFHVRFTIVEGLNMYNLSNIYKRY
jgi:hypothetical protein